ncbi:MAG: T9SS type A sorting domain-containing protein, partial [Ignavibacteriae bacterium]|nr:T9SS type A sorting domain-containing protein [Ignavibacteriota bacterium]
TLPNICFTMMVTGGEISGTNVPKKYQLSQNYPNPFNPSTKISYSLLKKGLVSVRVFDILGKEVAQLVNEVKEAGNYMVDFNGSDLTTGVYYYRIESGEFVDVKKMMLIK